MLREDEPSGTFSPAFPTRSWTGPAHWRRMQQNKAYTEQTQPQGHLDIFSDTILPDI